MILWTFPIPPPPPSRSVVTTTNYLVTWITHLYNNHISTTFRSNLWPKIWGIFFSTSFISIVQAKRFQQQCQHQNHPPLHTPQHPPRDRLAETLFHYSRWLLFFQFQATVYGIFLDYVVVTAWREILPR